MAKKNRQTKQTELHVWTGGFVYVVALILSSFVPHVQIGKDVLKY